MISASGAGSGNRIVFGSFRRKSLSRSKTRNKNLNNNDHSAAALLSYTPNDKSPITPAHNEHRRPSDVEKELVAGAPQQRNWRGIAIALLTIVVMCGLILAAVVLLTPGFSSGRRVEHRFSLDDMLSAEFMPAHLGAMWTTDETFMYAGENLSVIQMDLSSGQPTPSIFADGTIFEKKRDDNRRISSWIPASDGRHLALAMGYKKLFRNSMLASYNVTELQNGKIIRNTPIKAKDGINEYIRLFLWNPVKDTSDFAFVQDNNLYYQESATSDQVKITTTDSEHLYNGIADWLYEEEIFGTTKATWWSPDGNRIAFATFDDRNVETIDMPMYNPYEPYPQIHKIPYSKVGFELPKVSLNVWDKQLKEVKELALPDVVRALKEYYLFNANWLPSLQSASGNPLLVATWTNRAQNHTYMTECSFDTGICSLVYEHAYREGSMNLWAEPDSYKLHYSTPNSLFVMLPQATDTNVYTHIANMTFDESRSLATPSFLVTGHYDVTQIVGYNSDRDEVYFIAAAPYPYQRNLYRTSRYTKREAVCMTCVYEQSHNCTYFDAQFNEIGTHLLLNCQGPSVPKTWLVAFNGSHMNETPLLLNEHLADLMANRTLPTQVTEEIQLDNGATVFVRLTYPPYAIDKHIQENFPLILKVYGGPGSQTVSDRFTLDFDTYLASSRRYITAHVDGRGSGMRGWNTKAPIYRRMATVEIQDQIEAIQKLLAKHLYLHIKKVAVWGWSYGGFATAHIVDQAPSSLFKCAVSVAPVTDFRYYDAAYTERYMGLREDNGPGYEQTSLNSRNLTKFQSTQYMLIHGTGDDNVHFMNTAMFIQSLTAQQIQFRLMVYPNEQHSIAHRSPHLYTMIDQFFLECLQPKPSIQTLLSSG